MIKNKKLERMVSLVLALVMLVSMPIAAAENQTEKETVYRTGRLKVLFEDWLEFATLSVLCREDTETVWVAGEDFVGHLANYSFTCDTAEGTAEIQVWNRRIAFQAGSSETAYAIGSNECFYRMSAPALYYEDRFWIPADDFFYYLCCIVSPVSLDGDDSSYEPETDYLLVKTPNYTVLDVLYDIFDRNNGLDWMFTYEKDFGLTSKNIQDLLNASKVALVYYDIGTGNWKNFLGYASLGLTDTVNEFVRLSNSLLGSELEEVSSFYDTMNMESFLSAMLYTSEEEMETIQEELENDVSVMETGIEIAERTVNAIGLDATRKQAESIRKMLTPDGQAYSALAEQRSNALLEDYKIMSGGMEKTASAVGIVYKLLNLGYTFAGIIQQVSSQSQVLTQAVEYYLKESETDTTIPAPIRSTLSSKFAKMKIQVLNTVSEMVSAGIEEFVPDLVLKLGSLSVVGIATSVANAAWYSIEQSGFLKIAKASEAQALQLAMYGMLYEGDSWREMAYSYSQFALGNGLSGLEDVKDSAYLAINFLKACHVTTDAGLESLASADFAESNMYAGAKTKKRQLAAMLKALTDAVASDESEQEGGYPYYGILFNRSMYTDMPLAYDLFLQPSARKPGQEYMNQAQELNAVEQTIWPLVRFSGYYEYIRDVILPERGYVSTEESNMVLDSYTASQNYYWDQRSGILGADIADMNNDGIDDMLLYYFGEYQGEYGGEPTPNALCAELYTMNDNGEIYLVDQKCLEHSIVVGLDYIAGGLVNFRGKICLYTESISCHYFAFGDGVSVSYNFYEFTDEGKLLPMVSIGKTDGGESAIAYSLLTRIEGENYDTQVLWADSLFRYMYPEVSVLMPEDETMAAAVQAGFDMLPFAAAEEEMPDLNMADVYMEDMNMPSYANDETIMKRSFCFHCEGDPISGSEPYSHSREMRVTLADYTELKEHIDALDQPE